MCLIFLLSELEAEKQPELEPQSETLRDTKSGTDAEGEHTLIHQIMV